MTLLGIDCETTGLMPQSQILSLYMGVFDDNFQLSEAIDLRVKPDPIDGRTVYSHIEVEALQVNKIDLLKHNKEAITYTHAKEIVSRFLYDVYSKHGKLTPFGNMVNGDIKKICETLVNPSAWDKFCDRRVLELSSIGKTLQLMKKLPEKQSLGLSQIADYFHAEIDENLVHTAKYDVELGAFVLRKYMELLK